MLTQSSLPSIHTKFRLCTCFYRESLFFFSLRSSFCSCQLTEFLTLVLQLSSFFFSIRSYHPDHTLPCDINNICRTEFKCMLLIDFLFTDRYYVLYRLPNLTFLDSRPVRSKEREEAQRVGSYMKIVAPSANEMVSERHSIMYFNF